MEGVITKRSGGVTALNLYLRPCQEFGNELGLLNY